jgi:hypothetical protein
MSSYVKASDQPFAADGGVSVPAQVDDPFRALDDLMAVVETLCPTWPARPVFADTDRMLL